MNEPVGSDFCFTLVFGFLCGFALGLALTALHRPPAGTGDDARE